MQGLWLLYIEYKRVLCLSKHFSWILYIKISYNVVWELEEISWKFYLVAISRKLKNKAITDWDYKKN